MSDEKIHLPDFLIAELYKASLVDINSYAAADTFTAQPAQMEKEEYSEQKIRYLGENKSKIIIVVSQAEEVYMNENDLAFLTSILKACKLNLADIAIVNIAAQQVFFEALKQELNAQNIILFDVKPSAVQLPFLIPAFQLQKYADCTIITAPALNFINQPTSEGKLLKTKLWVSLKELFGIT